MLRQDRAAGVACPRDGLGDDLGAPRLDHRAPVRLLLVRDLDHVDLALEPEQRAGERERAAPLARAGLGREARAALLLVVVRLRDGGVRLVAAGRADALVLVVDPRPRAERLLEAVRAVERRRAPEAVDVAHLLGDLDLRARSLTSWRISAIGKSGARSAGPIGCPVPGCSTGGGGVRQVGERCCTSAAEAATRRARTSSRPSGPRYSSAAGGGELW